MSVIVEVILGFAIVKIGTWFFVNIVMPAELNKQLSKEELEKRANLFK